MGVIVPQGSCPQGNCPRDSCPRGSCPGVVVLDMTQSYAWFLLEDLL